MAGVSPKAVEASFRGLDEPPLQSSPHFEKPLTVEHAMSGDAFIAHEMNGEPLPMLNGFPIRLVVPGWFATYWVKALSQITLRTEPLNNFWVNSAYRLPVTPGNSPEDLKHPSDLTTPLTSYPTHIVFCIARQFHQTKQECEHPHPRNSGGRRLRHPSCGSFPRWRKDVVRCAARQSHRQILLAQMAHGLAADEARLLLTAMQSDECGRPDAARLRMESWRLSQKCYRDTQRGGRLAMQTIRILTVLFVTGLGILAYALYGRSGREASMAPPNTRPQIPIAELTALQPVKDIELEYDVPDMRPGPGQRTVRDAVCCLPLPAIRPQSACISSNT